MNMHRAIGNPRISSLRTAICRFNMYLSNSIISIKYVILAIAVSLLLLSVGSANGADLYVRAGATGFNNGSDWTNAYTSLPATLIRGNTYYIADGSYGKYTFNSPTSGTSLITIKKATILDHGTNAGWVDSYGSSQAQFTGFIISAGYLTIDGVVGGGPSSWKSGHGFKIAANYSQLLYFTQEVSNITLRHAELSFPTSEVSDDTLSTDHIYSIYKITNFTIEYCYFHDSSRVFILSRGWDNVLVQYCWFARNRSTPTRHAEGWSDNDGDNYVIRYNIWEDIEGTGVVVNLTGDCYNWEIYGNIVFWTVNSNYTGVGNGIFTTRTSLANAYNWKIYNNTVYNSKGYNAFHTIYNGSNNVVKNNLWYICEGIGSIASTSFSINDYNTFIRCGTSSGGLYNAVLSVGTDPFVSSSARNFQLKSAMPGQNVSEAGKRFNIDLYGKTRGADGVWDRGALEFESSGITVMPMYPGTITVK